MCSLVTEVSSAQRMLRMHGKNLPCEVYQQWQDTHLVPHIGVNPLAKCTGSLGLVDVAVTQHFSPSVSTGTLLAGKLCKKVCTHTVQLHSQKYNVQDAGWDKYLPRAFETDSTPFGQGAFREAYKPKTDSHGEELLVIKKYKKDSFPVLKDVHLTIEEHVKEQVQMHSVAKHIFDSFSKEVPEAFGKTFVNGGCLLRYDVSLCFACPSYFLGEARVFDFVFLGDILLMWLPLPRGRNLTRRSWRVDHSLEETRSVGRPAHRTYRCCSLDETFWVECSTLASFYACFLIVFCVDAWILVY